jgi:hypothetical protein
MKEQLIQKLTAAYEAQEIGEDFAGSPVEAAEIETRADCYGRALAWVLEYFENERAALALAKGGK